MRCFYIASSKKLIPFGIVFVSLLTCSLLLGFQKTHRTSEILLTKYGRLILLNSGFYGFSRNLDAFSTSKSSDLSIHIPVVQIDPNCQDMLNYGLWEAETLSLCKRIYSRSFGILKINGQAYVALQFNSAGKLIHCEILESSSPAFERDLNTRMKEDFAQEQIGIHGTESIIYVIITNGVSTNTPLYFASVKQVRIDNDYIIDPPHRIKIRSLYR